MAAALDGGRPAPGGATDTIGGGRYIMGETLGEGTFGQVRLGVEVRTSELVAIKVLERARISDADAARRLAAEIGILRLVEHSSLLRLLEVIEAAEATYLVTEHVGGGELFAHIDRVGHLAEADAAALFGQMLSAVHSLHELGVIHRDLKPENMLLLEGRAGGGLDEAGLAPELKIIDFGLGAILPSADDELLAACGSPHYAAPEMLIGTGYTGRRADLWSLGVCLYAMLCGVLPFDEDEPERLYDKIIAGQFGFDGCPPLSAEAVEMIRGLLTTDPKQRLTAPAALAHGWLRAHDPAGAARKQHAVVAGSTTDLARAGVLRILADDFGADKAMVVGALAARERSETTALYFLVRQREVQHGRQLDQPRFLPTPPPPRPPGAHGRRPVPRALAEAPTAFSRLAPLRRSELLPPEGFRLAAQAAGEAAAGTAQASSAARAARLSADGEGARAPALARGAPAEGDGARAAASVGARDAPAAGERSPSAGERAPSPARAAAAGAASAAERAPLSTSTPPGTVAAAAVGAAVGAAVVPQPQPQQTAAARALSEGGAQSQPQSQPRAESLWARAGAQAAVSAASPKGGASAAAAGGASRHVSLASSVMRRLWQR